ncbi:MAG TPA: prepilin-type N-terminal cleavage/methylation domain-containing protein [Acidobacteriota bacterium]|jgi:prepilin-type N-terminal cleavage/methylation domain-containing protein|nr:prepilin-type N-terminal cleavage/methylation domain-containing protein [Acidobacteriota bacterium]
MKRERGFTLLELLITLTLVSVLSVVVFLALRVSLNAYRKGEDRMQVSQREKVIIELVKTQIGSAYPVRPQGKFSEPLRAQQGEQAGASQTPGFFERLIAQRYRTPPLFKGEDRRVLFASFAPLFFKKNAGMSMISYALAPGEQNGTDLVESEDQYRGGQTYLDMNAGRKKTTVFFSGLEDGKFEYFGDRGQGDYSWEGPWDAETIGSLPLAIRITLTKKNHQRLRIVGLINADSLAVPGLGGGIPPQLRGIIGSPAGPVP